MAVKYSVVLPVFNEADTLADAVSRVRKALAGFDAEILIAEDGSTDGTLEIARALEKKFGNVRVLHSAEKLGRGRALRRAFESARGEVVTYMDSDLSTGLSALKPLLKAAGECEVVTGSRYLPESRLERDSSRLAASAAFNFLARLLLGSRLRDHQCGFKAFRRAAVLKLNSITESNGWFWDTEVLVLGQKLGFCVREIPVRWKERSRGRSKVDLLRDSLEMFADILLMRVRLWLQGILY